MKTSTLALAASALLVGAEAGSIFRRNHGHAHRLERRGGYAAPEPEPEAETCKIVTYTTWKEYTPPKPTYATTEYVKSTVTVIPTPYTTVPATYTCPVPTPEITTCSTTGTYTFPAKTVTVTDTETVCVPTSTVLPPGCHTYGYTTTEVAEKTTVTCPYATTVTSGTAIYTTKTSTIFECPTPGTYTYGGHTTTLTKTETITYPTLTCYTPATYSHPATTVTVTETNYVFSCPYVVVTPPPAPKPEPPKETYAPPPPVETYAVPEPPKDTYVPPKETYAPAPPKSTGNPGKIGDGKQWAVIYTPFLETDQYPRHADCKSAERIDADLTEIKKYFRAVRIYAPDCDGTFKVLVDSCKKHGLKIIVGVFFHPGSPVSRTDEEVDKVIAVLKDDWSYVEFVVIGNEAVWGGVVSSQTLVEKIIEYKPKFQAAGYTGYFTTSEVVSTLEANPGLCGVIDIVAVNIQPYFNGGKSSDAGKFIHQQMDQASNVCGGKPTYCLEAGWPSAGAPIAEAYATPEDQRTAINSIRAEDEGKICYFSPYNDLWKNPNMNGGVEQHFGCLGIFASGY